MKKFTICLATILFLVLSTTSAQNNPNQAHIKKQKLEQSKFIELAPGTAPGPIQYSDDPFDLQFEYPIDEAVGGAGIECDGNNFYIPWWNGATFFKYNLDGSYIGEFTVAGVSNIRDLAYDGTYFYGGAAATTIFQMDLDDETLISTFTAPVATRAIAYQDDENAFWANNWSDTPTCFNMTGTVLNSFNIGGDESFYGFAWMDSDEGTGLWAYSQKVGTSQNMLYLYDVISGALLDEFDMLSILEIGTTGDIAGGLFMQPDIVSGQWTLGGVCQGASMWGIEMGTNLITPPDNDMGVAEIIEPISGSNLSDAEPITIRIKNFGWLTQTDIPFIVTWNDVTFTDTLPGPLAWGESEEITLPVTADLSELGEYTFEACTYLEGEENPANDCKTKTVIHSEPGYCDASTTTEDEWIALVVCGDIDNSSGWQGGVADYTHLSTRIDPGYSENIIVENGNAWASDIVYVWVDWNNNFEFEGGDEEFQLNNVGGLGQTFEGTITAPIDETLGDEHRMRVRMTYSTPPEPCGGASYGEVEDYTIISGHQHNATIEVYPLMVEESLEPDQTSTQYLTISNLGTCEELTYNIFVNITPAPESKSEEPEISNIDHGANEKPAGLSEASPGAIPGPIQYSDDLFDLQFEYPCAGGDGEAGIETDGNFIYTTTWNGAEINKYDLDGNYIGSFVCGIASGVRDLAYDGNYFYGGAASTTIFEMDFDAQIVVSTITAPVATRAIAYDEWEDGFWANNWSDTPTLFNRIGATLTSFAINGDESFYGFAWTYDVEGAELWAYSQKTGTSQNMLYLYDIPNGILVEEFDMMTILTLPTPGTDIAGGLFFSHDVYPSYKTLGGLVQDVCIWGIEMGTAGIPIINDVGISIILEPSSGTYYTETEPITIVIKNYGETTQSNIPFDVNWNNDGYYTDTLPGPISYGEAVEFTLPLTVNMVTFDSYTFEACTYLEGDENPENDCKTKSIQHYNLYYGASTEGEDEWIANVQCGDIDNSSDWQGGVADYTYLNTTIAPGMSVDIVVTNGNAWAEDLVYVWVDWNDDLGFDWQSPTNEEFQLTNIGGLGETFEGSITAPADAIIDQHRMRIRMTFTEPPNPWGPAPWGEVEAYTIIVTPPDPDWLMVSPLSGTIFPGSQDSIALDFNSAGLSPGDYNAELVITSNDLINPVVEVPVTLTVLDIIEDPIISVVPDSLSFEVYTDSLAMDIMEIANMGEGILDYSMTIEYVAEVGFGKDSWLSVDPVSGSVGPGDADEIDIIIDAAGLEEGNYLANINIASNDPNNPDLIVPVTLNVIENLEVPIIEVEPMSLWEMMDVWSISYHDLTISNLGAGELNYNIEVNYLSFSPSAPKQTSEKFNHTIAKTNTTERPAGNSEAAPGAKPGPIQYSDGLYDLQFEYPIDEAVGGAGIECDGNHFYIPWWNGATFYKYNLDGSYIGEFTVSGVSNIRDLAYDGTYFYGGAAATTIFQMDLAGETLISTFTAPVASRAIAYQDYEGFWANNWSDTPTCFDMTGAVLNSFNIGGDESFYGFAWMDDELGTGLWAYSQKVGTSQNMLYFYDVNTGALLEEFDMLSILEIGTIGDIAGGLFLQPDIVSGLSTLGGVCQGASMWGIEMGGHHHYTCDVGISTISEPNSGYNLTSSEPITIIIKNYAYNTQSNIPFDVSWDGGYYADTLPGPLAYGESVEITLPVTADLSELGEYTFEACTYLDGDENADNDCKTQIVIHSEPGYCDASTTTEDEWIAQVICGDINNSSGWQGGVVDYTDQSTTIEPGMSEQITIENGNAWAADIVYVWVDWNNNLEFEPGTNEEFQLTNVGGLGQTFVGDISAPIDETLDDEHRMRVRMTYSTPPEPCGNSSYGEVEDYTIVSGYPEPEWLSVSPLSGIVGPYSSETITVEFNSFDLEYGYYTAELLISSNDTITPLVTVPVHLDVHPPHIYWEVYPQEFYFEMQTSMQEVQTMEIYSTGDDDLNYILEVDYADTSSVGWLSAEPNEGIIPPGSLDSINVMVNTEGLNEFGIHNATILAHSNSQFPSLIEIPVTLLLTGGPSIVVVHEDFEYEIYEPTVIDDFFKIYNTGDGNLDYNIGIEYITGVFTYKDAWLSVEPTAGSIIPNDFEFVYLYVDATNLEEGSYLANINIESNDPITPLVSIPVALTYYEECPFPPPINLTAEEISNNTIWLSWDEPQMPGGEIRWDDGINNDGIGLTGGGNFYWAAKWEGNFLSEYEGLPLRSVEFFPRGDSNPEFTLMIWTGPNASTLAYEQELTGLNLNSWNTVELESLVIIDSSQELWIGFYVIDPVGDFPAGCDIGPAVAEYGDMISLDGTTWESMSISYSLDYNWNIAGTIGQTIEGMPQLKFDFENKRIVSNVAKQPSQGFLPRAEKPVSPKVEDEYQYFNVYRNDLLIAGNIVTFEFIDDNIPPGYHEWVVSAMYPECESFSNTCSLPNIINEFDKPEITLHPNPAKDVVYIESSILISQITIADKLGRKIYQEKSNDRSIQINSSSFSKGIYLVEIETTEGTAIEKLVIR